MSKVLLIFSLLTLVLSYQNCSQPQSNQNTSSIFHEDTDTNPATDGSNNSPPVRDINPNTEVDANNIGCDDSPELIAAAILQSTNDMRSIGAVCGSSQRGATTELSWSNELAQAAFNHSNDMATNNIFSHTGSDGSNVRLRTTRTGFFGYTVGENIARGQTTAAVVQEDWLESPGHCENIMRSTFTHLGAACILRNGQTYWTTVFGGFR